MRELKRDLQNSGLVDCSSHPLRVRELKLRNTPIQKLFLKSHPLRVRELKRVVAGDDLRYCAVAPFTGA